MTIQKPEEARAAHNRLTIRRDAIEREIDQLSASASTDVAGLADGAEIDQLPIADLVKAQAELRIIDAALARAAEAVEAADRLSVAAGILERRDHAVTLISERNAIAQRASAVLDELAALLTQLGQNANRLTPAIRRGRGVETAGAEGFTVFDRDLLTVAHLQRLINVHLMRSVPGWRFDSAPPGGFTFEQAVVAASGQLESELDLLLGSIHPDDIAAIRAEQAQQLALEA